MGMQCDKGKKLENKRNRRFVCVGVFFLALAVLISGLLPPNFYGDRVDPQGRFIMDANIMSTTRRPWLVQVRFTRDSITHTPS